MKFAKIAKNASGNYFLADHNDEKLKVIIEFFLDKNLLSQFKQNIDTFQNLQNQDGTFRVSYITHNDIEELPPRTLSVRRYNKHESLLEEDNPLEIEINADVLMSIFTNFEELINQDREEITISEITDEYAVFS